MLLRRLKSNSGFNLIFIPIAVAALWMKSFWQPFIYDYSSCENSNLLFKPIAQLVGNNALVHVIVGALLVVALAFMMQMINARYAFIRIRNKLPGLLFVIVLGGFTELHTLHPIYLGAVFVLFAVYRLFSMFEKSRPYSAVFDVGFLLGVSALFCLNLIVLFPAFVIGVAVLSRDTKWREFVLILLGFVLPFLFAFSYAFITDEFQTTFEILITSITQGVSHLFNNLALQIYIGVLIFYTLIASIDILQQYDKKKISSRKYFTAFFWIFLLSLIAYIFLPAASQEMLIIVVIPVTFLMSNFFVFMKRRVWGEFFFALLLVVVVFLQFFELVLYG